MANSRNSSSSGMVRENCVIARGSTVMPWILSHEKQQQSMYASSAACCSVCGWASCRRTPSI
jgi:hypothetical protein